MKPFLLLFFLPLIHLLSYSQPKIDKITWVGENREHLNISKKMATLQKGANFQQFDVVKYVKNNYFILSQVHGTEFKQKYNIVRFTKDTLILASDKTDIFELGKPNEQNQYVFVNSMLNYKFVKLHFEVTSNLRNEPRKYTIDIDSAKKAIIKEDIYHNEIKIYKTSVSKKDYERLIKILSHCDIDYYPDENIKIGYENYIQILEIQYNEQKKIFKDCTPRGYSSKLEGYLWEYIALRTGIETMRVRPK
jgi:hypothetical protein